MIKHLDQDQESLIELLEGLKQQAIRGEIRSLFFVSDNKEDGVWSAQNAMVINNKTDRMHMLAELRLLERDVIDCFFQTRRQVAWECTE